MNPTRPLPPPPNETMTEAIIRDIVQPPYEVPGDEGHKVNDAPPSGMTWPAIKEWGRLQAVQAWQERIELHGPQPFPWPRVWWYAWRIGAMLAWAGGWWVIAETV